MDFKDYYKIKGVARDARRLQHDLNINLEGGALALDLIDEIETMWERLRRFEMNDDT
jgi:hypothetical protein